VGELLRRHRATRAALIEAFITVHRSSKPAGPDDPAAIASSMLNSLMERIGQMTQRVELVPNELLV
jgi:hypothetical protein